MEKFFIRSVFLLFFGFSSSVYAFSEETNEVCNSVKAMTYPIWEFPDALSPNLSSEYVTNPLTRNTVCKLSELISSYYFEHPMIYIPRLKSTSNIDEKILIQLLKLRSLNESEYYEFVNRSFDNISSVSSHARLKSFLELLLRSSHDIYRSDPASLFCSNLMSAMHFISQFDDYLVKTSINPDTDDLFHFNFVDGEQVKYGDFENSINKQFLLHELAEQKPGAKCYNLSMKSFVAKTRKTLKTNIAISYLLQLADLLGLSEDIKLFSYAEKNIYNGDFYDLKLRISSYGSCKERHDLKQKLAKNLLKDIKRQKRDHLWVDGHKDCLYVTKLSGTINKKFETIRIENVLEFLEKLK